MQRFMFGIAALAFTALLAVGADVQASGRSGGGRTTTIRIQSTTTRITHTNVTSTGMRSHLRTFSGWRGCCWFGRYGCYGYYSPADGLWFYWCQSQQRFLPISLLSQFPPTNSGIGPVLPGANAALPPLPPGGTPLPAQNNQV